MHAQPWCLIGQREYALILAKPHGLKVKNERHHWHIRSARDLESCAAEFVKGGRGRTRRARALWKNEDSKAFAQAIARGVDYVCAVQRIGRTLKQTGAVQQWPPPAATVQHRLHSSSEIFDGRHQRCDIQESRMIGD